MKQPLYFVCNPERDSKYALETLIWQKDKENQYFVEKRPLTKNASAHLQKMLSTYENLLGQKNLADKIKVVKATKSGDNLEFEYIEGVSAELMLIEQISNHDFNGASVTIDRLIKIVESLEECKINPVENKEYAEIFGSTYNSKLLCATTGLLDLNLDNVIVDKDDKWHLIDYEWVFDFPIPKDLLIERFFYWFLLRYQETFNYINDQPMLEIADRLVCPDFLYKKYAKYIKGIVRVQKTENHFRKHVMGPRAISKPEIIFFDTPRIRNSAQNGLQELVDQSEKFKRSDRTIKDLKTQLDHITQQNQSILSSRSYKLSRAISNPKKAAKYSVKKFKSIVKK